MQEAIGYPGIIDNECRRFIAPKQEQLATKKERKRVVSTTLTEKDKPAEQVKLQPVKQKKRMNVWGFVNSPYLFVCIPLLLGGFYLIAHPEYIKLGMNHPYAVAFILALPICVFAIKLVVNFFSVIEQWIRLQFEKARQSKKGYFFELVIIVFMFVSICEAGPFFNDIQHNMLSGTLGYITVLAFDLIAVVCIDARRKELAKGGSKSGIYLLGVIICALVSMTANLYSALQNFHAPADPSIPTLLKSVAPYIGIMFPVMIIFLAFSRDTEIEIDDAETYRKQQQKRVDFLAVRRDILEKVASEMERIELLKKREFFLKSIFFTRKKINYVIDVVTEKAKEIINVEIVTLKQELRQKEQTINEQVYLIQRLSGEMQQLSAHLTEQSETVALQLAEMAQLRQKIDYDHYEFSGAIEQHVERPWAAMVQAMREDVQRDQEQQISVEENDAEHPMQSEDTPVKTRERTPQQEPEIPANYGLTDEEKQVVINAFPALEKWFADMLFCITANEIVEMTSLRQIRITNAIASKKIKLARGRKNKVQTESFLRWLLQDLERTAKRLKRPARTIQTEHFLDDFLSENEQENVQIKSQERVSRIPQMGGPSTEELEAIDSLEKVMHLSGSNGHIRQG
jgi:hypothetical protein